MALLFLRVTQMKINKMRKTAVRMEDSGSYLMLIIMIMMLMVMTMIMMKKRHLIIFSSRLHAPHQLSSTADYLRCFRI